MGIFSFRFRILDGYYCVQIPTIHTSAKKGERGVNAVAVHVAGRHVAKAKKKPAHRKFLTADVFHVYARKRFSENPKERDCKQALRIYRQEGKAC